MTIMKFIRTWFRHHFPNFGPFFLEHPSTSAASPGAGVRVHPEDAEVAMPNHHYTVTVIDKLLDHIYKCGS